MNRQEGYYWCNNGGYWIMCRYFSKVGKWSQYGGDNFGRVEYSDSDFSEINETRILSPDEKDVDEYTIKRIRSLASSLELQEFKHEDTGKMFDINSDLLDRL